MTHPAGHPEPEPVPTPEPEPPQPIPPPDPVPAPEPPHADPADAAPDPAQAIAASAPAETVAAAPTQAETIAAADMVPGSAQAADDFIDGDPRTAPVDFPPVGAYPGEPGHPEPVTQLIAPVSDQPAAAPAQWQEPWHAQHERPGEWQTHPPEHLAWEHSPPPIFQEQSPIFPDQPAVTGPPPPPWQVPLQPAAEPGKSRSSLWVSLALTVILLLCGGGAISAYFLISNADTGKGAPDPATAVNQFMTAVYAQQDAGDAEKLVCRDARDPAQLSARVAQIKDLDSQYDNPTFRWADPAVSDQTDDHATVTVQLTLSTADEKSAQQTLTFITVHKTGWLVCDVSG